MPIRPQTKAPSLTFPSPTCKRYSENPFPTPIPIPALEPRNRTQTQGKRGKGSSLRESFSFNHVLSKYNTVIIKPIPMVKLQQCTSLPITSKVKPQPRRHQQGDSPQICKPCSYKGSAHSTRQFCNAYKQTSKVLYPTKHCKMKTIQC